MKKFEATNHILITLSHEASLCCEIFCSWFMSTDLFHSQAVLLQIPKEPKQVSIS